MAKMSRFWAEQAEWSQEIFGSDAERGPRGPLLHLKKEVQEALDELDSDHNVQSAKLKFELVDCLFLVFDAARRAGMSYEELKEKAFEKLEINKAREWVKTGNDEPVEHKR